ncbi:flexible cuticle protein 12-like [Culicoides brevitarsis]|uniref:flexible cuticle protein 12-like n=1 Tax=Culicoides brevitarsis TaxID=469753 RepID=UPI00307BD8B3
MKFIIVLAALLACVFARPQGDAETLRQEFDNIGVDGYSFAFETSNGIKREESAVVNNLGSDHESIAIKGQYEFVADDGQTYTLEFVADENGFQPSGSHLPKA